MTTPEPKRPEWTVRGAYNWMAAHTIDNGACCKWCEEYLERREHKPDCPVAIMNAYMEKSATLESDLAACRELLVNIDLSFCPWCERDRPSHKADCKLAALLARLEKTSRQGTRQLLAELERIANGGKS